MDKNIKESDYLPRWVTLSLGLVLLPVTLLCVAGSLMILLAPSVPPSALSISIGSVFLVGSIWMSALVFRLIFINPERNRALLSPNGFRVIGLVFAGIPIVSIALGTFWQNPILHSVMTVAYIVIAAQLFRLAKER
jgi:hypothetical protein